jgi:ABC-type phosphate/phosphonate transport system ATPase subunit
LVDRNIIRVRSANVDNIAQVSNEERGVDVARQELRVMYQQAFPSQQKIFKQVIRDLQLESTVFVSGAAGTGKSFFLKMLERYYRIHGYHVCKMAPTGVAAHNINGQTMHRFFGMTNSENIIDMGRLRTHVELYKKTVFD